MLKSPMCKTQNNVSPKIVWQIMDLISSCECKTTKNPNNYAIKVIEQVFHVTTHATF
jgi:hypothetical protein